MDTSENVRSPLRLSFATPESDFQGTVAQASGSSYSLSCESHIPRTLQEALEESSEARVVTSAQYPFPIVHVNDAWVRLCGYSADEAIGKTLKIIQGPGTNVNKIDSMVKVLDNGKVLSETITNYDKFGRVKLSTWGVRRQR